jgi:pimeloyl-ACP methyl ester carboxylesterase
MARRVLLALLVVCVAAASIVVWLYEHDLGRARAAIRTGSVVTSTAAGPIEYAETGAGTPVLSIHGAGGGFDQGLMVAKDLLGEGYRIIAPSRFGYLRTPIPRDSSPAAQADAHAALLSRLSIPSAVVVGVSAGARSAVELAIRHPERVAALIVIVPGTYSPTSPVSITAGRGNRFAFWAVNSGGDFAWWATEKVAPSILIRFMGVRPELMGAASQEARNRLMSVVESVEPLSSRTAGINVDSSATLNELPLSTIKAPMLIISARDDLFNTLPAAEFLAGKVPGASLIVYDDGGHLLVGHEHNVRARIHGFIAAAGLAPRT